MKIGLVSPFRPHDLSDLLDENSCRLLREIGGVTATPVTPMAREWLRRGDELVVFVLDPSVVRPVLLRGERLSIHVLPKRRSRHCLVDFYREEIRLVKEAMAIESPDVLSAQWCYDHALAALACDLPTAVTCHDSPLRCAWISMHWHMIYHLFIAWKVIRKADRLICVSPYTARHIQRYFRPRCPVNMISNGLDPQIFERGARRQERRTPLHHPYTLCCVGGWGELKNQKTLLRAFARLLEKKESARLVLFGPGMGAGGKAMEWVCSRNLQRNVEFRGSAPREQILDFLENEADLMVHSSLNEAHGMVLIEAMACGVPVVGGIKSGAVPWTLDEGRAGFLCDVSKAHELEEIILRAWNQKEEERRAMILRAWNFARERFQIGDAARANLEVLNSLVHSKKEAGVVPESTEQSKMGADVS